MTARIGLDIAPLDLLFFRDGRPFDAAARVQSGLPTPQTLAGAISTAILDHAGCDFEALARDVRDGMTFGDALAVQSTELAAVARMRVGGPWLARYRDPLVPVPASLRRDAEGVFVRLDPLQQGLPGWRPPEPKMLPLWARHRGRLEPLHGFLTVAGLDRFLAGGVPEREDIVAAGMLHDHDRRTGIAIDGEAGTTREGQIYAIDFLALAKGVSLYAEVEASDGAASEFFARPRVVLFGGENRRVEVRPRAPVSWPSVVAGPGRGDGAMILLTAPAILVCGWRPDGAPPVAAAVPGSVALSGWDLAKGGPKPTRFAVPSGTVFFHEAGWQPDSQHWPNESAEDGRIGFGSYVRGVWNYV